MKNLLKLSAIATLSALLTACSGGGKSGPSSSGTHVTPKSDTTPSINYVAAEHKELVRSAKKVVLNDGNTGQAFKTIEFANLPVGAVSETFKVGNITEYLKAYNQVYSTSFAIFNPEDRGIAKQARVTGLPTEQVNLPKGTATYQGNSQGYNTTGTLHLTANFDAKNVSGKIDNRKTTEGNALPVITLYSAGFSTVPFGKDLNNQSLEAVSFQGRTNEGYYTGVFAGPKAEEVVGFLSKERNLAPYEIFAGEKK